MPYRPTVLIIMDGWGIAPEGEGNAVHLARTPNYDQLSSCCPFTTLQASGEAVGLPKGQMGNSEVGHLNIGAGYVVLQDMPRIDKSIEDGSFYQNPALLGAIDSAKENNGTLHLMGLFSPGGVHSHYNHLKALIDMAKQNGLDRVAVHAFLDGRDTPPKSALDYLRHWMPIFKQSGVKLASIIGRYYAMDRDKRWDRTKLAYDLLTKGIGEQTSNPIAALEKSYQEGITDEFVKPIAVVDNGSPVTVRPGDSIIFYNFRADRARQLTRAFVDPNFKEFERDVYITPLHYVTMTEYDPQIPVSGVAFRAFDVAHPLAEVVSEAGLSQFHAAETEKYAHVTYFINGGREKPFEGEERLLVPSPKVPTYDLQPEMSAPELAQKVAERIRQKKDGLIIVNFANPDMVGHTGVISAAVKACETVDQGVGELVKATTEVGGAALIIADHGNAETMLMEDGTPCTTHTTNPVPCILVGVSKVRGLRAGGKLADVAPTLLDLIGIPPHPDMTGSSLIIWD